MKKLQTLLLGLALAISGSAFARTAVVVRHNPDGSITRVVRHISNGDHVRIRRDIYVAPRHHHHYHHYRHVRRVVVVHPAHHGRYVVNRTTVVRRYG